MFSLPNLKRLNDEAEKRYFALHPKAKVKKAKPARFLPGEEPKNHECECCGKPATEADEYYDIFGPYPKGFLYRCEKCRDDYGSTPEGFFTCDKCGKLHIENYTWELYRTEDEDGIYCLKCAFEAEIENKENWITVPDEITWERVRHSRHLIPVGGTYHNEKLNFIGNVEFDSGTGGMLTGCSSSDSTPDRGIAELRKIAEPILAEGKKIILILDAAYQFAISIGVYTRKETGKKSRTRKKSESEG